MTRPVQHTIGFITACDMIEVNQPFILYLNPLLDFVTDVGSLFQ